MKDFKHRHKSNLVTLGPPPPSRLGEALAGALTGIVITGVIFYGFIQASCGVGP